MAGVGGCLAPVRGFVRSTRSHVHRDYASVDDVSRPWPTLAAGAGRTGSVPDTSTPGSDANVREVATVGRCARSQPAVADGRAYLGVDRRRGDRGRDGSEFTGLIALDLSDDGTADPVAWPADAGDGGGTFTPAVRGRVVFAPVGEGITAFDARDGSVYWRNTASYHSPDSLPSIYQPTPAQSTDSMSRLFGLAMSRASHHRVK